MRPFPVRPASVVTHTSAWGRVAGKMSQFPLTLNLRGDEEEVQFMIIVVGNFGAWWQFTQTMAQLVTGDALYMLTDPEDFNPYAKVASVKKKTEHADIKPKPKPRLRRQTPMPTPAMPLHTDM